MKIIQIEHNLARTLVQKEEKHFAEAVQHGWLPQAQASNHVT